VYSIQHYVIKFVSDLTGQWFPGTLVSSTNKTDCQDIAEICTPVSSNNKADYRISNIICTNVLHMSRSCGEPQTSTTFVSCLRPVWPSDIPNICLLSELCGPQTSTFGRGHCHIEALIKHLLHM